MHKGVGVNAAPCSTAAFHLNLIIGFNSLMIQIVYQG